MADIELVIKIPEKTYEQLKFLNEQGFGTVIDELVVKGTPLPKGHGNLIDENELLKMTESYKSELGRLKADPFVKCGVETVESFIKEILPIIEADKENKNE